MSTVGRARDLAAERVALDERPAFGRPPGARPTPARHRPDPCRRAPRSRRRGRPAHGSGRDAGSPRRTRAPARSSSRTACATARGQLALDPDEALRGIEAAARSRGADSPRIGRQLRRQRVERRRRGRSARRATRRSRTPPAPGPCGRRWARAWDGAATVLACWLSASREYSSCLTTWRYVSRPRIPRKAQATNAARISVAAPQVHARSRSWWRQGRAEASHRLASSWP